MIRLFVCVGISASSVSCVISKSLWWWARGSPNWESVSLPCTQHTHMGFPQSRNIATAKDVVRLMWPDRQISFSLFFTSERERERERERETGEDTYLCMRVCVHLYFDLPHEHLCSFTWATKTCRWKITHFNTCLRTTHVL